MRFQGESYLVSLAGERGWVKNVRAAQGEAVIIHGRRTPIRLVEVPVEKRAPILLAYVERRAFTRSPSRAARLYFGTTSPSLGHMESVASNYPVFAIEQRGRLGS